MKEPIYLIELFAGIGSQAKALKNIGLNVIHHKVIEFDKYAVASYNAVHNTNFKPTDITQIKGEDLEITNTQFYTYLLTYSFPCQDLSLAGKGAGMTKGNSTRSGLLWEVERLLNECKELPQYLLLENVPQIHSKKNIEDFKLWQKFLEQKGYVNYWEDLNAKNYGIPQNRNRTFMVSIRKDVDNGYDFPIPFELKLRLKDMLEENVEEKYFLSDKMVEYIVADNEKWTGNNNHAIINKEIASTINTGKGQRRCDASNYICKGLPENYDLKETEKVIVSGTLEGESWERIHQSCRKIYNEDGISPTLDTMQGGYRQPKIFIKGNKVITETLEKNEVNDGDYIDAYNRIVRKDGIAGTITTRVDASNCSYICIKEKTKKGYAEAGDGVYINRPHQKRGCVQKGMIQTIKTQQDVGVVVKDKIKVIGNYSPSGHESSRIVDPNGIVPTVKENHGTVTATIVPPLRIRKLTPKECWRLMGFADEDFEKAQKINSNAQLYKQAGNSIVVNVLECIFKELFKEKKEKKERKERYEKMSIFDFIGEE